MQPRAPSVSGSAPTISISLRCLTAALVAAENFVSLLNLIATRSLAARHDDSYLSVRQTLDATWPSGQRTGSGGWRRERPGKYSIEAVTESTNLNQFTRYSRLRCFLLKRQSAENES